VARPPQPARAQPPAEAQQDQANPPPDAPPPAEAAPEASPPATADRQLQEMPENFRAGFPVFNVDVHAYNSDPQRRFVLINGKHYREGDTLAEGPRIAAIVPEGIVFDWQGQRVLYALSH
jgi:general secretion pathway protein B